MKKYHIFICTLFLILILQNSYSQNFKKFGNEDRKYQELENRIQELEQKVSFLYNYINNLNNSPRKSDKNYVIKFSQQWYYDPGVVTNSAHLLEEQNRVRDSYFNRLKELKNNFYLSFLKINDCYYLNPLDEDVGNGLLFVLKKEYFTWFLKQRKSPGDNNERTKICFEGTLGFFDSRKGAMDFVKEHLPEQLNYFVEEFIKD